MAGYPIASGEPQSHYLGGPIENARRAGVGIKTMLLDRGFASVLNMLEMESQDVEFVMPLPGNDKLYGIMQEYHDGKAGSVREYTDERQRQERHGNLGDSPQGKTRQGGQDVGSVRGVHHQPRGGRS